MKFNPFILLALMLVELTSNAKTIKLPKGILDQFEAASKAASSVVEKTGTRVHLTTNLVVVPSGTNVSVVSSGTNIAILVSTSGPSLGTNAPLARTNLVVIPSEATNPVPALSNMVFMASGTNVTVLNPGTNIVVTASTTTNLEIFQTNLIAYIQIQSEAETASEFGPNFSKAFFVGEVTVQNPYKDTILVYSSSLQVQVKYVVSRADYGKLDKDEQELVKSGWLQFPRRPATFSDILAIFDYQEKKNWKQRTVDLMKSAGQIAAGATVFVGGSTYPKAVAFVTGIISPEIEKHLLWDLLMHAKNLESRSFKEIEEVPPFKPITKLVFFPKGGIMGIIPDLPVYLSYFQGAQDIDVNGAKLTSQEPVTSKVATAQ